MDDERGMEGGGGPMGDEPRMDGDEAAMSDEARMDERIRGGAGRHYNRPPPTPREEIWTALEARLRAEGTAGGYVDGNGPAHPTGVVPIEAARSRRSGTGGGTRWVGVAVAAGAALLLGVGIGRMSAPPAPDADVVAEAPAPAATDADVVAEAPATPASAGPGATAPGEATSGDAAVRTVAARHLAATESLLSFVQADARAGRFDDALGHWGRGLLVETRMLLDAGAGGDPALRELLLDLEMILAQVAVLAGTEGPERGQEELRLIMQGVDRQQMMARIQTALPAAGVSHSGT